jgi:hypothetical protein
MRTPWKCAWCGRGGKFLASPRESNRSAALLALGAGTATVATLVAAFAAETTATATTTATTAASAVTFAALTVLTAVRMTATVRVAAFAGLLAVAWTAAVFTPEAAAIAAATTPATTMAVATLVAVAPRFAVAGGGSGCCGGLVAAEETLEPAEETAGLWLRGGLGGCFRALAALGIGLILARLELAILAARLARLERPLLAALGGTRVTLTLGTGLAWAIGARFAIFTRTGAGAIAAAALGAERRAIIATRLLAGGGSVTGFPADRAALFALRRENVEFGFLRGSLGDCGSSLGDNGCGSRGRGQIDSRAGFLNGGCDRSGGHGCRGRSGGGLRGRLVDDGRAHGGLTGERVYVLALRGDNLERAGFVTAGRGGAGGGSRRGGGSFATSKAGASGGAERTERLSRSGGRGAARRRGGSWGRGRCAGLICI